MAPREGRRGGGDLWNKESQDSKDSKDAGGDTSGKHRAIVPMTGGDASVPTKDSKT
jgi:hypothetical protein